MIAVRVPYLLWLLCGLAMPAAPSVAADLLVLTADHAYRGDDIRLEPSGTVQISGAGQTIASAPVDQVLLIRHRVPPVHVEPASWLVLQDGQRLRGRQLDVTADGVRVTLGDDPGTLVPLDDIRALFLRTARPGLDATGNDTVRLVRANGDVLDVPFAELTEAGLIVDLDPATDPLLLPLNALQAVIWPAEAAANSGTERPDHLVELRTGERFKGRLLAWDNGELTLSTGSDERTVASRDVTALWSFGSRQYPLQAQLSEPQIQNERPRYRLGRNALGGPLRIGLRAYDQGVGLHGPVTLEVNVPRGVRWFVADVGVDSDAAAFARVSITITVDGEQRWEAAGLASLEPARTCAVRVAGAQRLTIHVRPVGDDPTGCLGDVADAMFIE